MSTGTASLFIWRITLQSPENNRLLTSLSVPSRNAILAACTPRELPVGTYLYRPEEDLSYVYFITSGIASVVLPMVSGQTAEVALVGKEGLTGALHLIGHAVNPMCCFVQLSATGLRIRRSDMEELFHSSEEIRHRILEFIQQESFTLSQIAGCNSLHTAGPRLARWLLMAQDRTDSPILNFTQEFLAEMLSLQRSTVNAIANSLQEAGFIDYQRGRITIANRPGLEHHACACYRAGRERHSALYLNAWSPRPMRSSEHRNH